MKLQNEGDRSRARKGGGTPGPAIRMFFTVKGGGVRRHIGFFFLIYILPQEPKQSRVLSYDQQAPAQWLQILCVGVNSFAQGHGMVRDEIRGKTAEGWT